MNWVCALCGRSDLRVPSLRPSQLECLCRHYRVLVAGYLTMLHFICYKGGQSDSTAGRPTEIP